MRYRSLPDSENVVDRRDRAGLLGTAEGLLSPVDAVMSAPHVINQQYIQPWLHGGKYSNYDADIDASIERDSAPPSQQNQVLMPPGGPANSRWAKGGVVKHRGSLMPLHHGTSKAVFSRNVSEMMHAGHPQDQALAAAYRMKREGRQQGGVAPWIVRNEARAMQHPMRPASHMTHTGPVPSIVPGRTDRHNVNVASGSYVLPADHVSSLGQGNTAAGYAILNRMFSGGPYGGKALGVKHGSGAPRPPRMQKPFGSDEGGGRGGEHGSPTPVVIAGGEYVIPPHVVEAIGAGIAAEEGGTPLQRGHEALDEWVVQHRKKHVKTLRKLPPPAKR